ncbi:MAG: type II secretion system F family protein [Nitrososphaerota archaeon]|jgi:flagellar protein FlaJ|nr:type II secretion system F family protein [Nitrososphaerota archaeon]MDG6935618.1 type II secretion system F family protein [Nitrososphaerota archaeon]MDG6944895.1 type II secretion system F family protein [Nitrososphaerota archaeon]
MKGWKLFMLFVGPLVVLSFFGMAIAEKSSGNVYGGLFGSFLAGASIGLVVGGFATFYSQMKGNKITLPKVTIKRAKVKRKNPYISKLSAKIFKGDRTDILSAGVPETPSLFYYRWASYFFYTLVISVPASFISAFLLKTPVPLVVMLAPFAILLGPTFQLKSGKGDRRRAIDDELPFFALYSATLADAGISVYQAFKKLVGEGIFRSIEKDALYLIRSVEFLGQDHITAMDELARNHPSKQMSDLLFGYTSEIKSGGSVAGYLMDRAEELLQWLEFRFEKYGDSVSDIGEMMTALFFILPTLVLAMAFVSPGTAVSVVWMMNALVIPLVGVAIIFQIRSMQPRSLDIFHGNLKAGIAAGAVSGVILFLLRVPAWAVVASGTTAGTLAYSVNVFFQKRVADEEENSLESFVRDLTEYRKAGYTIQRSIDRLSNEGKYARSFTETLKSLSAKMKLGFRLSDMKIGNSWIGRQVFFLLGQVEDTGGGSAKELEAVHRFVERYTFAKRSVKSRMKIYQMLSIMTPVGLALLIFVMSTMVGMLKFSPFSMPSSFSLGGVSSSSGGITIPPSLFQASYIMVIISSVFMSLSATEASDFTIKNMWRVALTVLLASLATFFFTSFGGTLLTRFMPSSLFVAET